VNFTFIFTFAVLKSEDSLTSDSNSRTFPYRVAAVSAVRTAAAVSAVRIAAAAVSAVRIAAVVSAVRIAYYKTEIKNSMVFTVKSVRHNIHIIICILVCTTLKMATRVAETCWLSLDNEIKSRNVSEFVGF
jgi:hypothetical protein